MNIFKLISFVFILLICGAPSCNNKNIVGLDGSLNPSQKEVKFYVNPIGTDSIGVDATIYRIDGTVLAKGHFADSTFREKIGTFTFYYPNGSVESSGKYDHNDKTGEWVRYSKDGRRLAIHIYDPKILRQFR